MYWNIKSLILCIETWNHFSCGCLELAFTVKNYWGPIKILCTGNFDGWNSARYSIKKIRPRCWWSPILNPPIPRLDFSIWFSFIKMHAMFKICRENCDLCKITGKITQTLKSWDYPVSRGSIFDPKSYEVYENKKKSKWFDGFLMTG